MTWMLWVYLVGILPGVAFAIWWLRDTHPRLPFTLSDMVGAILTGLLWPVAVLTVVLVLVGSLDFWRTPIFPPKRRP